MLNCLKKLFVIILLFSFLPLAYAMEDENTESTLPQIDFLAGAKLWVNYGTKIYNRRVANAELWNVIQAAHINDPDNYSPADFIKIANCLDKGADPNVKNKSGYTLLSFAAFTKNVTLIEFLIKCGVNVNQKNSFFCPYYTSLEVAAAYGYGNYEKLKLLCDAGASLTDAVKYPWSYGNIFHRAFFKEPIEIFITHGRFNAEKKIINQDQYKKLTTIILALKKWSGGYQEGDINLPDEIQDQIIAYLSPESFQIDPDNKLCSRLLYAGYKNPFIFAHIYKRIENIKQLLQSSSLVRGTAMDYILSRNYINYERKKELKPILDGSEIDKHYRKFSEEFPSILESDPKNLITIMYGNCARLEVKK